MDREPFDKTCRAPERREEITLSVHATNALKHKDITIDNDNTNNNTKVLAIDSGVVSLNLVPQ